METLQVYSSTNGDGEYDQLAMRAPRKLKCDVSSEFPYQFLEKKQQKNKFESNYETIPQTAIAETKHTITTDTNKIIHRKRISKPLPLSFQNPLSRRGEHSGVSDGKFKQAPQLEQISLDEVSREEKRTIDERDNSEEERDTSTPIMEIPQNNWKPALNSLRQRPC